MKDVSKSDHSRSIKKQRLAAAATVNPTSALPARMHGKTSLVATHQDIRAEQAASRHASRLL